MKKQDAIEFLKQMQNPLEDYADVVGAPGFAHGCKYVYPDPEDYAIDEAIAALKKQIPEKVLDKKTIKDFNGNLYSYKGNCPCCNHELTCVAYCWSCGQILDWD